MNRPPHSHSNSADHSDKRRRRSGSNHSNSSRDRFRPPEFIFVVKYRLKDDFDDDDSYRALNQLIEAGKKSSHPATVAADDHDDSDDDDDSSASSSSYEGSDPSNFTQDDVTDDTPNKEQQSQRSNTTNGVDSKSSSQPQGRPSIQKQLKQIRRHRQGGMVSICSILPPIMEESSDIDSSYSSGMSELRLSIKSCGENIIDLVLNKGRDGGDGYIGDVVDGDHQPQNTSFGRNENKQTPQEVGDRRIKSAIDDDYEEEYWKEDRLYHQVDSSEDYLDVAQERAAASLNNKQPDPASTSQDNATTPNHNLSQPNKTSSPPPKSHYKRHNTTEDKSSSSALSSQPQDPLSHSMPELSASKQSSFMEALRIVDEEKRRQIKLERQMRRRHTVDNNGDDPVKELRDKKCRLRRHTKSGREELVNVVDRGKAGLDGSERSADGERSKSRSKRHSHHKNNDSDGLDGELTKSRSNRHSHHKNNDSARLDGSERSAEMEKPKSSSRHSHHKNDSAGLDGSERSSDAEKPKSRSKRHSHHKNKDSVELDGSERPSDEEKPKSKSELTKSRSSRHSHHKINDSARLDGSERSSDSEKKTTKSSSKRPYKTKESPHKAPAELDSSGKSDEKHAGSTSTPTRSAPTKARSRRHRNDDFDNSDQAITGSIKIVEEQTKIPQSMAELLKSLPTKHGHKDPEDIQEAIGILSSAIELLKAQESKSRASQSSPDKSTQQDTSENMEGLKEPTPDKKVAADVDSIAVAPSENSSIAYPPSESTNELIETEVNESVTLPPWENASDSGSDPDVPCWEPESVNAKNAQSARLGGENRPMIPSNEHENDPDLAQALAESLALSPWESSTNDGSDDLEVIHTVSRWKSNENVNVNKSESGLASRQCNVNTSESGLPSRQWEDDSDTGSEDLEAALLSLDVSIEEREIFPKRKDGNKIVSRTKPSSLPEPMNTSSSNSSSLAIPPGQGSSGDLEASCWKPDIKEGDDESCSSSDSDSSRSESEPPSANNDAEAKSSNRLLRLVRPKSMICANPSQKQKEGFMSKVRNVKNLSRSMTQSFPVLLGDGMHAVEGGAMAIEDGIQHLKMKAKERKQKVDSGGDVVLNRRRHRHTVDEGRIDSSADALLNRRHTVDEGNLRRGGHHDITSPSNSRLNLSSSRETDYDADELGQRSRHSGSIKSGNSEIMESQKVRDNATPIRRSATRSSQTSVSKSTVSRRSSMSSTSTASINRRNCILASSFPRCGLNALNTNDRGELLTWDDLEDAIYIGLHNSISDINSEVNHKQEWKQQSTESIHSAARAPKITHNSHNDSAAAPPPSRLDSQTTNRAVSMQRKESDCEKGPWRCSKCTFINDNPLHLICGVCQSPRE